MHIQGLQAVLTADGTAPVELTLTLGHSCDMGGVVASPAAHDFTAVHASGGQVAHTSCCTQGAWKISQGYVTKKVQVECDMPLEKTYVVTPQGKALTSLHHSPGLYHQFWGPV